MKSDLRIEQAQQEREMVNMQLHEDRKLAAMQEKIDELEVRYLY